MSGQDLTDRLRSVLEVYYDWVQVESDDGGKVSVRVGKRQPTERDMEEFLLRVNNESGNGEGVTDVELRKELGEIVGVVSPEAIPAPEEASADFTKHFRDFAGVPSIIEDDKLNLSRFSDVAVKTLAAAVDTTHEEVAAKVEAARKFFEEQGFERVEERFREDTYVSHDGKLARVNLFAVPDIQPSLRVTVYLPKSVEEASMIRRHFGLGEMAPVDPTTVKEVSERWEGMVHEDRMEFLNKQTGMPSDRAETWAGYGYDRILDLHPYLARQMAEEMAGIRT